MFHFHGLGSLREEIHRRDAESAEKRFLEPEEKKFTAENRKEIL
jgi:hypothetical protein